MAMKKTKLKLRKVTFYDRENKKFEFLTNLFELRADLIAVVQNKMANRITIQAD